MAKLAQGILYYDKARSGSPELGPVLTLVTARPKIQTSRLILKRSLEIENLKQFRKIGMGCLKKLECYTIFMERE
jgi:hypothetical protein